MNVQTSPIDVGPGYDKLADAMRAEGLFQVRYWQSAELFTVEMRDKRTGQGRTIREAIENASHIELAA